MLCCPLDTLSLRAGDTECGIPFALRSYAPMKEQQLTRVTGYVFQGFHNDFEKSCCYCAKEERVSYKYRAEKGSKMRRKTHALRSAFALSYRIEKTIECGGDDDAR
jgi:hypothetical protein